MIYIDRIQDIPLVYDRQKSTSYGVAGNPQFFYMEQDLYDVLDEFTSFLDSIGWKHHIVQYLTAGAYVKKNIEGTSTPSPHADGIAFDLDGVVISNGDVFTAKGAPDRLYWRMACILSMFFGVVLHRLYNDLHVDHFHVDLSKKVGWRNGSSQILLVQKVLNTFFNANLDVDGDCGHMTKQAWMAALDINTLDYNKHFIELIQKIAQGNF
jgi:hypothetical protein